MKRLFQIFVVVVLLVILFFEYRSYQRHRASDAYAFPIDSTINWSHPDPTLVKDYLFSAAEVGQFGRYAWSRHGVDVLTDSPEDPEAAELIRKYQLLVASAKYLEGKLTSGDNHAPMRGPRISGRLGEPSDQIESLLNNPIVARPSDQGALVYEIQKKLRSFGSDLPIDGIYRVETENAVRQFQQSADLYPSGVVDRLTLIHMFQN